MLNCPKRPSTPGAILPTGVYAGPVRACFPEPSESQAKAQHWTTSLNLAETQSERSDHKSSPFVPKRTKRDTSCNHKNSMYTRQNGTKGVRAIGQGPILKQGWLSEPRTFTLTHIGGQDTTHRGP